MVGERKEVAVPIIYADLLPKEAEGKLTVLNISHRYPGFFVVRVEIGSTGAEAIVANKKVEDFLTLPSQVIARGGYCRIRYRLGAKDNCLLSFSAMDEETQEYKRVDVPGT